MKKSNKRRSVASTMRTEADEVKYSSSVIGAADTAPELIVHKRNVPVAQFSTN